MSGYCDLVPGGSKAIHPQTSDRLSKILQPPYIWNSSYSNQFNFTLCSHGLPKLRGDGVGSADRILHFSLLDLVAFLRQQRTACVSPLCFETFTTLKAFTIRR